MVLVKIEVSSRHLLLSLQMWSSKTILTKSSWRQCQWIPRLLSHTQIQSMQTRSRSSLVERCPIGWRGSVMCWIIRRKSFNSEMVLSLAWQHWRRCGRRWVIARCMEGQMWEGISLARSILLSTHTTKWESSWLCRFHLRLWSKWSKTIASARMMQTSRIMSQWLSCLKRWIGL